MNPYDVGQLWLKAPGGTNGSPIGTLSIYVLLNKISPVSEDGTWHKWRVLILYADGEMKFSEPFLHHEPSTRHMTRIA